MKKMRKTRRKFALALIVMMVFALMQIYSQNKAEAAGPSIGVDASKVTGILDPKVTGGMFEWANPEMNGVWADRVSDRSFEYETVNTNRSPLYDHFDGTSLDESKWTKMLLAGSAPGTVSVSNSELTITGGEALSRFGVMTNVIPNTDRKNTTIETKLTTYSGTNALMNIYGGAGAGDFSHFVEYGVEGGVLKVYTASGSGNWTGSAVSLPVVLKVVVGCNNNGTRTFDFYSNGTLVHTLTGNGDVPDPYRVFLYGFGTSTSSWDYLTVSQDSTYDGFDGTSLSSRWTPTLLAGSTPGSVSEGGGQLTVNGGSNSRYGVLSDYIRNSAIDWTTVDAHVNSITGTNALLNIYGGSGAGDFSHFVEYGVEGGELKVFTSSGAGNWVGGTVSTPGTLSVQVTPYSTNGRTFKLYWNGSLVYTLTDNKDVPAQDFRVFLYGWSTSVTKWDYVNVSQEHFNDPYAPNFEGNGLSGDWQMELLAGSNWGTESVGGSNLTINGASGSRYGAMSRPLEESDIYGYTISARLTSYSGTNALLNLYGGSGRGDFSHFVEFGIEGGVLKVYTPDGTGNWVGGAAAAPAVLKIEVSPYGPSGRDLNFYYNNELVYQLHNYTQLPDKDYQVFLYGYGTSTTVWDYMTYRKHGDWTADGYADQAIYSLDRNNPYNGSYSERIDLTQHNGGRKGISLPDVDVTAGHNFTFGVWLRQSSMTGPVTVMLGPAGGDSSTYTPYASGTISSVGTSWIHYTLTLTPNTTDEHAKLFIGCGSTGTLWLDMASLMPTDPSEVTDGFRKDWVDKLVAANPHMLRWPGGIISDWQHWQDGVGPRDSRPPIYYGQWNTEWMTNDVGTDEVLNLMADHNITPYLNVNWGTGTSNEAANWVQYTNGSTSTTYGAERAANGHSAPYGVKYWGIGNETWGAWTPNHTDAGTFSSSYTTFHDAMAAEDPGLNFTGEGSDGNNDSNAWTQTLVSRNDTKLDNVAIHYYSPQSLPQGYSNLDVYKSAVGAAVTHAARMEASQNAILDKTEQNIKLAITEYNAMYFHDDQRRTRTVEAALQNAGFLNLMAKNPQYANFNNYSQVANFWDGGYIRTGVRGVLTTPSYDVLSMFSNDHGPISVQTGVSGPPTYNAPAIGNLPAVSNVPMLDAAATKSADGTTLYLSVLNRDDANAQQTTINLSNAGTIGGTATAYSVGGDVGYLTQNTWQNPNAVTMSTHTVSGVGSSFTYTFPAHSYTILKFDVSAGSTSLPAVAGRVVDGSGNPLSGATVTVTGGGSTVSNSNGNYFIPVSAAGSYDLTASLTGYNDGHKYDVKTDTGGTTATPIRLEFPSGTATGQFHIGGFLQPPTSPTDLNTSANWANIADAGIDTMMRNDSSGSTKSANENAIANSYANDVKLLVTDDAINNYQSFTTSDYAQLESDIAPYAADSRAGGLMIKDEPDAWNMEGYANSYRDAKQDAPGLQYYVNLLPFFSDKSENNWLLAPPGKFVLSNSGARGSGTYVTPSQPLGQSFKVPSGTTKLNGIQLYLDARQWSPSEPLTLKLWDSPSKTHLLGQASLSGFNGVTSPNDVRCYPYFQIDASVTPGQTYYWELVHNGGGDNSVGWVTSSSSDVYPDGAAYVNGAVQGYDFWFRLYSDRDNTPDIKVNSTGNGDYVKAGQSLGQTFTTPATVKRFLYYIQPYIDYTTWNSGQGLTMTLWDSPAKKVKIAQSPTLPATNNGYYPYFYLLADVKPNTSYYWELTSNSGNQVGWVTQSTSDVYTGGQAYKNGSAISGVDRWFNVRFGSEYENYIDDWLNISKANFIQFDNYPFRGNGADDPDYFLTSELIRSRGLDRGVKYGAFLQSMGITRTSDGSVEYRAPTLDEMRYNVYTYLAYGMKNMYWFTYWHPQPNGYGETFNNTPVDFDGTKLGHYWYVQTLDQEMKNLGRTLKDLTSVAVYHSGTTIPRGTTWIPDGYFVKPEDMTQPIEEGVFTNPLGRKYVMLVNRDYTNSRTLNFDFSGKPSTLTEISKKTGEEINVPGYDPAAGVLNISFEPGEGRLFALPSGY